LENVTIGKFVDSIDDEAFAHCKKLSSIEIPGSVESIGQKAFQYCESLKTVTIMNGPAVIYDKAFESCDSLESVVIPGSVEYISNDAFNYCDDLSYVCYLGLSNAETYPDFPVHAFDNCPLLGNVTVPYNYEGDIFCGKPVVRMEHNSSSSEQSSSKQSSFVPTPGSGSKISNESKAYVVEVSKFVCTIVAAIFSIVCLQQLF